MPRPRRDGTPARAPNKRKFSDIFIKKLKAQDRTYVVWDTHQRGLAVMVQRSGHKSWKCVYTFHGRPRWYHIGDTAAISLADARKLASRVMFKVAEGKDPCAERQAERSKGTFEELAAQYVAEYASKKNKSWKQAEALVHRNLLPRWAKLQAADISRADVKAMMARMDAAPIAANQSLAAASAIFTWGIKEGILTVNPCTRVERNETTSRERILSASEIPKFWAAFDSAGLLASTALKIILLTGQRPGEVTHMRREHIVDGWWEMPGNPVPALDWPGTKNGENHRVWLSVPVQDLLAELDKPGQLFSGPRGGVISTLDVAMRAICADLGVERATPHDLRRTNGTAITARSFGRDAMNRIQNHKEGGIASVYDRHSYADENKRIMNTVAADIIRMALGPAETANVVRLVQI